ncbi:MAG TPA: hypothetical protein VG934_03685 [Candidatus Paceibacterota bacterium]|nr:hypothetical protein [Candidatus Paceibacterota bacterium]
MNRTLWLIVALVAVCIIACIVARQFSPSVAPLQESGATSTTTAVEAADTSLGQYTERQNSPAPPPSAQAPAAPAPLEQGCALHFSFVPASKLVAPGGSINYTFTISNQGTDPCKNASFSAYYDDNERFVSASPKPTASTYYWSVGDLASRAQKVITAITAAGSPDSGQISNEACATADNSKDVCAQNTIFVGANAPAAAPTPPPAASGASSAALPAAPSGKEVGIWVWDSPVQMAPGYAARMLAAASQNGFNTIYITVDDYLDIASLPDGAGKTAKTQAYFAALASIVSAANQKSIAIVIEGGAKDWAYPENRWKGYALIDMLAAYNKAYPSAQVRGLQYDVEPYLLPEYEDNKAEVLEQFVEFIDGSVAHFAGTPGTFEIVIPHFYDSEVAWTPSFTYGGTDAYAYTHLLQVLERRPGSEVVVMAYRNFFAGDNGTEQISQAEVKEASNGYSTRVIVAQETGNVDPSYVTFYGMTKADLLANIQDIYAAFDPYKSFGGVAVHYLEPFLDLK